MSIKIFNGYKIEKNMLVFELSELLNDTSQDFQEVCKDLYHNEVAKLASKYLDFKTTFGKEEANGIIKDEYEYTPKTYSKEDFKSIKLSK